MSNSVIRAELDSKLKAWADAQIPKVPVAYEGFPFTKPTDGVFVESFLIPAITMDSDVSGDSKRYLGIYQINCWARSGRGMKQVETLAQNIINLFPMLPKTGSVSIESTPYAEKYVLDQSGWVILPVTIQYRYEAS